MACKRKQADSGPPWIQGLLAVCLLSISTVVWAQQGPGLADADTNNDGKISRDEAHAAQDKAFDRLDTNGDGRLDYNEFAAGQPDLPEDADAEQEKLRERVLKRWFRQMDDDDDGYITRQEYHQALEPYFDQLDTDGDGYISAEEMRQAFQDED